MLRGEAGKNWIGEGWRIHVGMVVVLRGMNVEVSGFGDG